MNLPLLKPKHTLVSVLQELLAGLKDGTIFFEPRLQLFPDFQAALRKQLERTPSQFATIAARVLGTLTDSLAHREALFVGAVSNLETLFQVLQELRQVGAGSKRDLLWLRERLEHDLNQPFVSGPPPRELTDEILRRTQVLIVALDRDEVVVVNELALELQIAVAKVLKSVLEDASRSLNDVIERSWKSDDPNTRMVARFGENALSSAASSRFSDLDARAELLRLALEKEKAGLMSQSFITRAIRRELEGRR